MVRNLVRSLIIFSGIAFIAVPWVWAQPPKERIMGEELDIIRVRISGVDKLIPKESRVKPGTTVVWLNTSKDYFELYFTGEQVEIACKSPTRFNINPEGGFYSDRIPPGAVASLCFIEKGIFEYTVVPRSFASYIPGPKIKEIKGTIIVE
jgi:plastocyanin